MKKLLLIILSILLLSSCTKDKNVISKEDINNGFPILDEYKDLIALENNTDYNYSEELEEMVNKHQIIGGNGRTFSAWLISNMMSMKTAEIAIKLKNQGGNLIENLSEYNIENLKHLHYAVLESDDDDLLKWWYNYPFSTGSIRFINTDIMVELEKKYKKVIGACVDMSSFNSAIVRLWGVSRDDLYIVNIPSHVMTSFKYGDEIYMMDNNYITRRIKDGKYISLDKDGKYFHEYNKSDRAKEVTGLHNDAYYFPSFSTKKTLLSSLSLNNFFNRYQGIFNKSSDTVIHHIDNKKLVNNLPYITRKIKDDDTVSDISSDVVNEVYSISREYPKSQYTLAKYVYQTLLVKYPESYIRENKDLEMVIRFSKDLKTPSKIIEFVKDNIVDENVFSEPYRILDPEQVLVLGKGNSKERAILIQAMINSLENKAKSIFTNKSSYLFYIDNGEYNLYDTNTMKKVNNISGVVTLILDSEEVYYPSFKRNTLKSNTISILNSYGIKDLEEF